MIPAKPLTWLGWLLLIPSLLFNYWLWQRPSLPVQSGVKVLAVLDGDTVVLDGQVRMRLRHVDAPEPQNCGGQEAKQLLTNLVEGKQVEIKEQVLEQNFGRPMALIYQDGNLINQSILESGWVRFHHDTTSVSEQLKQIGLEVKEQKLGIFSDLCLQTTNSDNPKCNIKGNIDPQGKIKRYYYPGCAQYNYTLLEKDLGEQWFCSEKDAQSAGWTKAETCR